MRRSEKWQSVRFSRNGSYEPPYSVTGVVKLTGSEQAPKYEYEQIELSERGKQHNAFMRWRRRIISAFNCCESGGTSCEALVMRVEQQPPVIMKDGYR